MSNKPRCQGSKAPSDQLSKVLREEMDLRGLTSHEVAVAAGLAPSMVHRFRTGERGLSLATAGRIAGVLGLRLVVPAGRRPRTKLAFEPQLEPLDSRSDG